MKSLLVKLGVILIGLAIFGHAEVWGADWKVYFDSEFGIFFYNAQNITRTSKNLVRVWVKQDYTAKGVIEMVARLGEDCKNLAETIDLWELNCTDKKTRLLQVTHYSKDGGILFTGRTEGQWDFIIPESMAESLYEKVCK